MAISAKKRLAVYERDGYVCVSCKKAKDVTIDHVIPRSAGGHDGIANLQTMCRKCNNKKGNSVAIPSKREARRRWFAALKEVDDQKKSAAEMEYRLHRYRSEAQA